MNRTLSADSIFAHPADMRKLNVWRKSLGWMAGGLVDYLAGWVADLLAGWTFGWLAGWLAAWLPACLAGWLA